MLLGDRRRIARLLAVTIAGALAPWGHSEAKGATPSAGATGRQQERRLVLFYTAEVHGAVEPCGCTSDPLGGVSRLAAVMADVRRGGIGAALVDAGNLSYPEGAVSAKERPSADLRAEFLAAELTRMGLLGAALGETDLTAGPEHVRPRRLASNLTGAPTILQRPLVEKVGGIAVGVLGISEPAIPEAAGGKSQDMTEAARRDVVTLKRAGAEVVVLLAAVDRNIARRLARESGADVIVLGKHVGAGTSRPEKIGRAFLVAPADEMQKVGRLEIVLRGPQDAAGALNLQDAGGPEAAAARREEISRTLERLRVDLATWTGSSQAGSGGAGRSSEGAFVEEKKREQADLEAERARLNARWAPPTAGNYIVNTLVPLRKDLRRDRVVEDAMKKLDQRIAAVNLQHVTPPPPSEPGRAFYVGARKCAGCHPAATTFWRQTVHGRAWKTLVNAGKQADYKCVSCHLTGFGQVGGSSLGFTKQLESVQCETCHGPGSSHVAGGGNEEPLAIKRDTPEAVCLGCHTEHHSDTFQFEAYMRDIVGPGHAPRRRESLGPGATGHALRAAAVARAKLAGAEQIKKQ
jgi:Cytochrome c554 and c-prime